ncbi:MAG: imidazole glycerol phosphate synthase subunit HisF [Deltaproteobacteria bacterium]|nr:imidazole glycerol phosphate synthase subunit HisF [Deltaproteobacteria bacterium]
MITVLDYGAGNVRSVINAIERAGESVRIVEQSGDISAAEKLVFPGVGSFGSMMHILNEKGYVAPLKAYLRSNRPFLGICLGLQALFESSSEAPGVSGLGFLAGTVQRLQAGSCAVPHIGWNGIRVQKPGGLFSGLAGDEKFYFVHSYHVVPHDRGCVLTETDYGSSFTSAIQQGNIAAIQFHPEKSGAAGLRIFENFIAGRSSACVPERCPRETRLARRIIACLDVRADDRGNLVVTKGDQYDVRDGGAVRNLGDPVEMARRYYEEGADEITFLNITGFRNCPLADMPMLDVLQKTSRHVFVPLTIGGGIREYRDEAGCLHTALDVAAQYFRSGADKISIGSDAVLIVEDILKTGRTTGLSSIEQIARVYGSQAVVISIDPRRMYVDSPDAVPQHVIATDAPGPRGERWCWYECTVRGGREGRPVDAVTLARVCQELGAGELLLNCIDRDGTCGGFDLELINAVKASVSIPVIASSGAGSAEHFAELFVRTGAEAALAAGIFHRGEVPLAAVKKHLAGRVEIRTCG